MDVTAIERKVIDTNAMEWASSPSPTVWRKRLELIGPEEAGRVTSLVRYDPDSAYPPHPHPGGEEILVLDGTFSDEHGDYPTGSFLLNPERHVHAPYSKEGCVLFVKLRQYAGAEREQIFHDTGAMEWQPFGYPGVSRKMLYQEEGHSEVIYLAKLEPGLEVPTHDHPRGEEIFVLEGTVGDERGEYGPGSWILNGPGSSHAPFSKTGAIIYVKIHHLDP